MELKLNIQLTSSAPATVTMPVNKYNKLGWFAPGWDDGEIQGLENGLEIWDDIGLANDDGCGNEFACSGSIAVCEFNRNVRLNNDTELISRLLPQIPVGSDITNHSAKHDDSAKKPQVDIVNDLVLEVFNYMPNGFVVPVNYVGFAEPVLEAGMVYMTAQGDYYDPYNAGRYYLTIPNNPAIPADIPMFRMARAFFDAFNEQATVDYMVDQINGYGNAPAGSSKFCILDTHDPLTDTEKRNGFRTIYQHLLDTQGRNVSVFSLREALEYRKMRTIARVESQVGNLLTVTINTNSIPKRIRWRDISLMVSGATIQSVTHEGFDSSSFNAQTGLVNGFREITDWNDLPPDEPQEIFVKHGMFVV